MSGNQIGEDVCKVLAVLYLYFNLLFLSMFGMPQLKDPLLYPV